MQNGRECAHEGVGRDLVSSLAIRERFWPVQIRVGSAFEAGPTPFELALIRRRAVARRIYGKLDVEDVRT